LTVRCLPADATRDATPLTYIELVGAAAKLGGEKERGRKVAPVGRRCEAVGGADGGWPASEVVDQSAFKRPGLRRPELRPFQSKVARNGARQGGDVRMSLKERKSTRPHERTEPLKDTCEGYLASASSAGRHPLQPGRGALASCLHCSGYPRKRDGEEWRCRVELRARRHLLPSLTWSRWGQPWGR